MLYSPTTVLKKQIGNCFDYCILLCSLLIGNGYDAYCVSGYATRELTNMDETREECPFLVQKNHVSEIPVFFSKVCIISEFFVMVQ